MPRKHKDPTLALVPSRDTRPMSDRHQLWFANVMAPMTALVAQVNQVAANTQEQVALMCALEEGLDPEAGWRLNVGAKRWEKHPVPPGA
jgi:hypothetical protein